MRSKVYLDSWKIFRILSEFVDGFETMQDVGPSVSIFGSARTPVDSPYYKLATEVAEKIAKKGFGVITGGGPGVMEAANKGAQQAHGRSCGIAITLPFEDDLNPHVDPKYRLHFRYFFVRKVMFIRYAQAFVVLPGGFGTLDEVFEALTLIQTKKIKKFPIYLIGKAYWEGLIDWLRKNPLEYNYLTSSDFDLFTLTDDIDSVVAGIEKHFKEAGEAPTYELTFGEE